MSSATLGNLKIKLAGMQGNLDILDPANVLKRGYSITTLNGKILKNASEAKEGDILKTRLSKGEVESEVTQRLLNHK
jgi:exodeoxyribonuclease VII large subunit